MKLIVATGAIIAIVSGPLSAEEKTPLGELAETIKNIAQGVEQGNGKAAATHEVISTAVSVANSALNDVEDKILSNSNFTHFELSLGSDTLGLDTGKSDTKSEAMTVYGLKETNNWFMFNQTAVVNFNDRTTVNTGFGARYINETDTIIVGANVFYDYEMQSKHKRSGVGLELFSSIFELRANQYKAASKTLTYKNINETALDGSDVKLTSNLPYFFSSSIYGTLQKWKDGVSHNTEHYEAGFNAEIVRNLTLNLAAQHKNGSGNTETVGSLIYSIPLGRVKQPAKEMQDGVWTTKFKPIREKLYKPVQRENRVMKKAIKLGVTVSGY